MKVRIISLNYNGEKVLQECLPSLVEAAKHSRYAVKVAVIDNQSRDSSLQILKEQFPSVEVWVSPVNRVLCSFNDYLKLIPEDIVILMNNDLRVDADFVDSLIEPFEKQKDVFMVTPKSFSFDGSFYEGGRSKSCIKYGLFWNACVFAGHERHVNTFGPTMAAGYGAFDRAKFLELGGYDDLYLPGRLEDNDVCFRAWRKGWKLYFQPASRVYHQGATSFNAKFGNKGTLILGHRNSFLFFWKNIRQVRYWFAHIIFLIPRLLYALLTGKGELVTAFFQALCFIPAVCKSRAAARHEVSRLTDSEIFAQVV